MTPTLEELARRKEGGEAPTEEDAMVSIFKLASPVALMTPTQSLQVIMIS